MRHYNEIKKCRLMSVDENVVFNFDCFKVNNFYIPSSAPITITPLSWRAPFDTSSKNDRLTIRLYWVFPESRDICSGKYMTLVGPTNPSSSGSFGATTVVVNLYVFFMTLKLHFQANGPNLTMTYSCVLGRHLPSMWLIYSIYNCCIYK